ncbi:MAG: ATP-binding protein [Deltaproteobacteria bacterium]|nr:ATP-binding protein [Deltaproteobacteria bacterium]
MEQTGASADFLRRAAAENRRYGGDPWVFIRELGQNARDASGRRIEIRSRIEGNRVQLSFADDGSGMSLAHARKYLFRLYASSKEGEASSAGRYGVGFWSVLCFQPDEIRISSRCGGQGWGVGLSGDLSRWWSADCERRARGTTIVLERDLAEGAERFTEALRRAVERYLVHLRTAGRRPKRMVVRLDGQRVDRPFSLDSPGQLVFRDGAVEGVVGFGPRPAYTLYARGLPVAHGAYLEELEGLIERRRGGQEREGMAPSYLLNGNDLEVVISRQMVRRDRALRRLLRTARSRFEELVSSAIDGAAERSWSSRIRAVLGRAWRGVIRGPAWMVIGLSFLALVVAGGLVGLGLSAIQDMGQRALPDRAAVRALPAWQHAAEVADPELLHGTGRAPGLPLPPGAERARIALETPTLRLDASEHLGAGTVSPPGDESVWALRYRPGRELLFRLTSLERFDPRSGWYAGGMDSGWRALAGQPTAGPADALDVEILLAAGGSWLVPVPSGHAPLPGSARLDGAPVALERNGDGLYRLNLPRRARLLRYRLGPQARTPWLRGSRGRLGVELPPALRPLVSRARGMRLRARIAYLRDAVADLVRYERSAEVAAAYRSKLSSGQSWLEKVIAIGFGDCDVQNGVLAVLLRESDVEARLVVGIAGHRGRGWPGLHAWVEADEAGRLAVLDASSEASSEARIPDGQEPPPFPELAVQVPALDGALEMAPDSRGRGSMRSWVHDGLLVAGACALGLLAGLTLLARRRQGRCAVSDDRKQRRELLASMAADALRRPAAWRNVDGIWHRPFLPAEGGRMLTLLQLVKLSRAGRVFLGRRAEAEGELVGEALRCKLPVLDPFEPDFGPLYRRVTGLRDLAELVRFKPLEVGGSDAQLLAGLDGLVSAAAPGIRACAVRGDVDGALWDVDLSPIAPCARSGWPARFVAINLEGAWWRAIRALHAHKAPLALAVAADRIASESRLLGASADRIRRAAARGALGSAKP